MSILKLKKMFQYESDNNEYDIKMNQHNLFG